MSTRRQDDVIVFLSMLTDQLIGIHERALAADVDAFVKEYMAAHPFNVAPTSEETELVERAMRCVEHGSAHQWQIVAGYLRDEVLRLRAELERAREERT